MATRTTFNGSSVGVPWRNTGLVPEGFGDQYARHLATLYGASVLPLTGVGGTGDVVTASLDPVLASGLADGMKFTITWGAANTGAVTLALNGGAAVAVLDATGTAMTTGALASGRRDLIEYIGGSYRVLSAAAGVGAGGPVKEVFTSSGTWTKPSGYADDHPVLVRAWGAGGGGSRKSSSLDASGGGGGGYIEYTFRMADLPSSVTVTIGAAGAGRTGSWGDGGVGGNSTFGALLTAYGGGGGGTAIGGGGAGSHAAGGTGSTTAASIGGGPGGSSAIGGVPGTIWGGAGGGAGGYVGGNAVWGGGGGGGGGSSAVSGGVSVFGGNGGAGGDASPAPTTGQAPGGGGGGGFNVDGANGARGQIEVWVQ